MKPSKRMIAAACAGAVAGLGAVLAVFFHKKRKSVPAIPSETTPTESQIPEEASADE